MNRRFCHSSLSAVVFFALAMISRGDAASPYRVVSVTASNPVLHGLEVKTPMDAKRRWVSLRGPQFYSSPEQINQADLPNYLNWYAIRKPESEAVKQIVLSDQYSGSKTFSVMIGDPAFYLIPAQTIQDGPPKEVPEQLNRFIAFRIANVDSLTLPEPTPGKPAFVCVPAEEWHHEAHFAIKSESMLLMVYEVNAKPSEGKVTTIDPFGINALTTNRVEYLYVEAKRVEK